MSGTESATMDELIPDSQITGLSKRLDSQREFEIINNLEDITEEPHEFLRQTMTSLVSKFGSQLVKETTEEAVCGGKRKRVYKSKSVNHTEAVRLRLKELELSCRVSFFTTMNRSQAEHLHEHFVANVPVSKEAKAWLADVAKTRISQNFNTWKYRTTDNLVTHVRMLNKDDPEFKKTKNKSVAASILEKRFNLESFVAIFDFLKGWIDLQGSERPVKKFCKLLYVELVSFAKMHTIWLDDPKHLEASEHSRKGLGHRISTCAVSEKWARFVPAKDDIKLATQTPPYKRKKKRQVQFKNPDEAEDFYVMEDSDTGGGDDNDDIQDDLTVSSG
ncbi:hypothetical protein GGS21DRAFT_489626 [Xylaria nigripes]|nr:hypothetical protein GGS21DRAFT_489626 [Xylaria nigripes]